MFTHQQVQYYLILNQFPEDVPCAIEYPCGGENKIKQKIEHDKNELQSWVPSQSNLG